MKRLLPLLLALTACTSSSTKTAPPLTSPFRVGGMPCGVLSTADAVWVSNYTDATVVKLDPVSFKVLATAKTGLAPCGAAEGAGSVWVEDYGSDQVTRVSAATGKKQADYKVGTQPYDVAFLEGAAWSTDYADGTLTRIDAVKGTTSKVHVGGSPSGVAPAGGFLWVAVGGGEVVRVDPTSRAVKRIPVPLNPTWTAWDDTHVWLSDTPGGKVVVLDVRSGAVLGTADVGGRPADGDVLDGVAWFPDRSSGEVVGVDATGKVVGRHQTGLTDPFVLDSHDGKLWVGEFGGTRVAVLTV